MSINASYDVSFIALVRVLERVERTSSRLEIAALLSDYLCALPIDEMVCAMYLMQGSLDPVYHNIPFQIAGKTAQKMAEQLLGVSSERLQELMIQAVDVADVIRQHMPVSGLGEELRVSQVVDELRKLHDIGGEGSAKQRPELLLALCERLADPGAIAFLVRIVQGTLRAGFSDMTIIQALSRCVVARGIGTQVNLVAELLEHGYMRCADLGYIAQVVFEQGLEGLSRIRIRPGIPSMPAAAERAHHPQDIIARLGIGAAQPKLDGFRVQVHAWKESDGTISVRLFSRHLHDVTHSFPDVVAYVNRLPVTSLVMEGEAIAYDKAREVFLPFTQTVKRRRKHDIAQTMESIPLSLFVFDLLYLNGQELIQEAHSMRRAYLMGLQEYMPTGLYVIPERIVQTSDDIQVYFEECLEQGLEGLVIKKPDAPYQIGKRGFAWIKLKRHQENLLADTVDAVILGYYRGQGRRAQLGIGAFLVGIYNGDTDQFQTVAKVGTGLTDQQWIELKSMCDSHAIRDKLERVVCASPLFPDVWVEPVLMCEIAAEEITLSPVHTAGKTDQQQGFALRFPRLLRMRPDKSAYQTTSWLELKSLRRV